MRPGAPTPSANGAQAGVQHALPALKDAKERLDFKAAAGSMVEVGGTLGGEFQKPNVQQMAKSASELFIESAASKLGAKAVQDGKASPTEALQGAAAMSQAVVVGVFGEKLKDPAVVGNLREVAETCRASAAARLVAAGTGGTRPAASQRRHCSRTWTARRTQGRRGHARPDRRHGRRLAPERQQKDAVKSGAGSSSKASGASSRAPARDDRTGIGKEAGWRR